MGKKISFRLFALSVVGVVMVVAVGLFGAWQINDANALAKYTNSVRASTEADMFHDAIRADVQSALLAQSVAEVQAARNDLNTHANDLLSRIATIRSNLQSNPRIAQLTDTTKDTATRYIAAANAVVDAAAAQAPTDTARSEFQAQFSNLEGVMQTMSDQVETLTRAVENKNASANALARTELYLMTIGFALLTLGLSYLISRGINRSLRRMNTKLESAAATLTSASARLVSSVDQTRTEASQSSVAADQISGNVQLVATASEELAASISEISLSTNEATDTANHAVEVAHRTGAAMETLGQESAEIGRVLDLIHAIADRTNMLAINATIESARAGDAGRGFAVVASSVKDLANQTAEATTEIARKVKAIQAGTTDAIAAMHEIASVVNVIADAQSSIAAAVEEQAVTTDSIAANAAEAANESQNIAGSAQHVAEATGQTAAMVQSSDEAINDLRLVVRELNALV